MSTPEPRYYGECHYPIRDGEDFEARTWGPEPRKTVHVPECPASTVVPCPPCLSQILRGQAAEPHECSVTTFVVVDTGRLIVGPERDCTCACQRPAPESAALQAARAQARRRTP